MVVLVDKVRELLLLRFPGSVPDLRTQEGGRIWGILVWSGFEGVDQILRQSMLREVLENQLRSGDRRQVSAILTMAPSERNDDEDED